MRKVVKSCILKNGLFPFHVSSIKAKCVSVLFTDMVSASSIAPDSRQIVSKYLMNPKEPFHKI